MDRQAGERELGRRFHPIPGEIGGPEAAGERCTWYKGSLFDAWRVFREPWREWYALTWFHTTYTRYPSTSFFLSAPRKLPVYLYANSRPIHDPTVKTGEEGEVLVQKYAKHEKKKKKKSEGKGKREKVKNIRETENEKKEKNEKKEYQKKNLPKELALSI